MTSCIESPMIKKSPFGSSLIWETLRPGWNCLNSPRSLRQFLCSALIPLCVLFVFRYHCVLFVFRYHLIPLCVLFVLFSVCFVFCLDTTVCSVCVLPWYLGLRLQLLLFILANDRLKCCIFQRHASNFSDTCDRRKLNRQWHTRNISNHHLA